MTVFALAFLIALFTAGAFSARAEYVKRDLTRKTPLASRSQSPGWVRPVASLALILQGSAFLAAAGMRGTMALSPLAIVWVVRWLPYGLVRFVFIPLGMPRAARIVGFLCFTRLGSDRSGVPVLFAALALLRQRTVDSADCDWVEERVRALEPMRGAGLAAAALCAHARGDRAGARALFESVRRLDGRALPKVAVQETSSWLAADAMARGRLDEVIVTGTAPGASFAASFLAKAAICLRGDGFAPGPARLWLAWLLAPRRRFTWALLQRALVACAGFNPRQNRAPDAEEKAPRAAPEGDSLARAIALHAGLVAAEPGRARATLEEVRELARAWDRALADAEQHGLSREPVGAAGGSPYRAGASDCASSALVIARLRASIEEDVIGLARRSELPLDDLSDEGVGAAAKTRLRDELLRELEVACDALRARVDEARALPPIDEWRELVAIVGMFDRGQHLGGPLFVRLAFPKVHADLGHFAVRIFNKRKEHAIGNAGFRFLFDAANLAGDEHAAEAQRKNIDCGV